MGEHVGVSDALTYLVSARIAPLPPAPDRRQRHTTRPNGGGSTTDNLGRNVMDKLLLTPEEAAEMIVATAPRCHEVAGS